MLFRLGDARSLHETNELGTYITAAPPDYPEFIRLFDTVVAGKEQDKFLGNVETYSV